MLKRFIKNTSGNFAMMFAVGLVALMAGVGAAVDLNTMVSTRSSYQNMADAAVLAAARSGETDPDKLQKIAKDFIATNNFRGDTLQVETSLSPEGRFRVQLGGTYKAAFQGIFGRPNAAIGVAAEAPLAVSESVNIVLVLDSTFSMTGTKMTSLKEAASGLVTTLAAFDNDALKMSVIPFSQYINVGTQNRSAVWLDVADDYVETLPQVCVMERPRLGVNTAECRMERFAARPAIPPNTCYEDDVPYECGGQSARPGGSFRFCPPIFGPREQRC